MSTWKVLAHNDLLKYGGERLIIFIDKIKEGEEFLTSKGLVKIHKDEVNRLQWEMPEKRYKTIIKTNKGNIRYPQDFFKTPEFGGKGKGAGTAAEDRYLGAFEKEIEKILTMEEMPYIDLNIGGRIVQCSGVRSTKQTGRRPPKGDFTIFDVNGNAVAWISHKAGFNGSDFQQYGGVTDPVYNNKDEVQKFAEDCRNMFPVGFTNGTSLYRKIKDKKVIGIAVYGLEYGSTARSKENIDEFHQGFMKLKKKGRYYEIESNHKGLNGDIPGSSWEAFLLARYSSKDNNLNVKSARLGIFPKGKIPGTAKEI